MNDRYLFKAKRIDTGEWVQGFLFKLLWDESSFDWCIGSNPLYPSCAGELSGENIDWFYIDESTICPCTGMKDKDDNLIFENDICAYFNPEDRDGIGIIRDGFAWWKGGSIAKRKICTPLVYLQCGQNWKVIGNIFGGEKGHKE